MVAKLAKVEKPSWKEKDKLESFMEQFAAKSMMQLGSYFYGLKSTLR
jgi:protease-4